MNLKKYLVICICLLFIAFSFNILSKYSTVSGENLSLNNIDNEIANNEEAENLKIEYEKLQTRIKNEEMIEINRKQNFNTKNAKKRKIIARDIQCLSPAKTKEKEAKVLLDALYEEGIIPTYSFPKNVVSTYIMNEYGRTQYEIERGLDIAIGEYAPGRGIVVDKKIEAYFENKREP